MVDTGDKTYMENMSEAKYLDSNYEPADGTEKKNYHRYLTNYKEMEGYPMYLAMKLLDEDPMLKYHVGYGLAGAKKLQGMIKAEAEVLDLKKRLSTGATQYMAKLIEAPRIKASVWPVAVPEVPPDA